MTYLFGHGVQAVAITRGSGPVVWAVGEERGEIKVPQVQAGDTLGAGDIFHGALCYFMMNSVPWREALAHAAEVAAYSCRFFGTRAWMEGWLTRDDGNPKSE
jgi:sugar/nucleoside kinase (ribokinase family)